MEKTEEDSLATPPPYQPPPPPYGTTADTAGPSSAPVAHSSAISHDPTDPSEILPPVVLILDKQVIYAESDPALPLYQVNRGLASLGPPTRVVELERVEHRLSAQTGRLKSRPRHIYNLRSMAEPMLPLSPCKWPEYYMECVNARWAPVGHLGLRESRSLFREEWTAKPVRISPYAHTIFDTTRTAAVFKARYRHGVCTWTDAALGREVALQHETAAANATTAPQLIITAPQRRDMRDALVALWCLYVWEQAVNRHVDVPLPRGKLPRVSGLRWQM